MRRRAAARGAGEASLHTPWDDVPTLIVHGDDDQVVPIGASALASAKIVQDATLKIYEGGPHGLPTARADELNADILDFIQSGVQRVSARSEGAPLTH